MPRNDSVDVRLTTGGVRDAPRTRQSPSKDEVAAAAAGCTTPRRRRCRQSAHSKDGQGSRSVLPLMALGSEAPPGSFRGGKGQVDFPRYDYPGTIVKIRDLKNPDCDSSILIRSKRRNGAGPRVWVDNVVR